MDSAAESKTILYFAKTISDHVDPIIPYTDVENEEDIAHEEDIPPCESAPVIAFKQRHRTSTFTRSSLNRLVSMTHVMLRENIIYTMNNRDNSFSNIN